MMSVHEAALALIGEYHMLQPGDRVIAALSGGADSVSLLLFLDRVKDDLGICLSAVHVNHGIRGEAAAADEAFCKALCRRLDIPLAVYHEDIPALAAKAHLSEEEAGRKRRYEIFAEEAEREGAAAVALAHHADDVSETFLLNLLRGSGLKGLAGIEAVRPLSPDSTVRIIRPFLRLRKAELEAYLAGQGESWCRDATNADENYTRNRIRLRLIPLLEEIAPGASQRIAGTAEILRETDDYLDADAALWKQAFVYTPEGNALDRKALAAAHPALKKRLLRELLEENGGTKDVTRQHYEAMAAFAEGSGFGTLDLPGGRCLMREQQLLRVAVCCPESAAELPPCEITLIPRENQAEFPEKEYTKCFDYDKINHTVQLRTRQEGDYFLLPDGGRKSVKSYFIDKKIPASKRDSIPLAAAGSHIIWIVGMRMSAGLEVTEQTKTILKITVGGYHGETSCGSTDQ